MHDITINSLAKEGYKIVKRQKIIANRRKKRKSQIKLLFLSILVLLGTTVWYMIKEKPEESKRFIVSLTENFQKEMDRESESLQIVDNEVINNAQYATGNYINVYNFIQTVNKVDNRGLKMNIGKDGYYQMTNNDDTCDFNILQLTDLHLTGSEETYNSDIKALETVYTMIQRANPDLIVLTGDVIFGTDGYDVSDGMRALNVVCRLMDRIGIPWIWSFGNHDHSFFDRFSNDSLAAMLAQSATLKMYPADISSSGYSKGVFKLYNSNGSLSMGLIILDSGNEIVDDAGNVQGYDYIRDDQVEWYAKEVGKLKEKYGSAAKTMLFFHIPLQEYETAWEEGSPLFGTKREPVYDSEQKSRLFDRALELQSTVAMFCGHDHLNDYGIIYKGIELVYSKSIDYIAYPGIDKTAEQRGATQIAIDSSGAYSITQLQYE